MKTYQKITFLIICAFGLGFTAGKLWDSKDFTASRVFEHGVLMGINEGIELYKRTLNGEQFENPVGVIMSNSYAKSPLAKEFKTAK